MQLGAIVFLSAISYSGKQLLQECDASKPLVILDMTTNRDSTNTATEIVREGHLFLKKQSWLTPIQMKKSVMKKHPKKIDVQNLRSPRSGSKMRAPRGALFLSSCTENPIITVCTVRCMNNTDTYFFTGSIEHICVMPGTVVPLSVCVFRLSISCSNIFRINE